MSETTFPKDDIDPKQKGEDYCRKWSEAIFNNWMSVVPKTMFAHAADKYEKIKSYALGYQDISKYKKGLGVDEAAESSWLNIDWSIRPILSKFRRIALGKLQKTDYNVNFFPVDPLARDEVSKYFSDIKAKIMLREKLLQQQPDLANMPAFTKKFGEPEDLEELQMQMDYGSKTNISIEAEEGVTVVLQDTDNDINEHRKAQFENFFDYGVSGQKSWIDNNGRVRFRTVDLRNILTNYCRKRDFRDLHYAGEIIQVPLTELSKEFDAKDMQDITGIAQNPNPQRAVNGMQWMTGKNHDASKAYVLDCEWKTYNSIVRRQAQNEEGNVVFKEAKFKNLKSSEKTSINGTEKPKYISKTVEVIYRCKWIIGSEYVYDFGMAKDQPRSTDTKQLARTELSYSFYAPDFHEMRCLGIMEQIIPMADEYQLMVYKIQNLNNRMMPFGWAIDLDAIEDVALGAGGKKLDPAEVLDMFFQSQILTYRKKDLDRNNVNYKPIEVIQTSFANEMTSLYNYMVQLIGQIRDISGLNEMLDGSTAGKDRMPNGLIQANTESANNALFGIIDAEKVLMEKLAIACFRKLQIALKAGDYGGYIKAIGGNSVKLITVSPDLALHEFAITCEVRPTDEDKQLLLNSMQENIAQGFLDLSDVLIIMDMYSTRKAYQLLAYKVKKNKADMQNNAMQQQQMNGQVQTQSAQAAEQMKQQTATLQHQFELELLAKTIEGNLAVQELKNQATEDAAGIGAKAKVITQAMGMDAGPDSFGTMGDPGQEEQGQMPPQQDPSMQEQPQPAMAPGQ